MSRFSERTRARRALDRGGIGRRAFVLGGLAAGGLLLRSLATGLPPSFLASPARAQVPDRLPQTLVLATSSAGDPVNTNVPGTYIPGAVHPDAFADPVDVVLGRQRVPGAAPWAALPADLRQRLAFVHYASRSPAHTDYRSTMGMHGAVRAVNGNGGDMFASMIAGLTAATLAGDDRAPLQVEPLPLGPDDLTASGRPLQTVNPSDLAALFAPPDAELAVLEDLRAVREDTLDRLYGQLRQDGTRVQKAFVDRYLRSAEQARQLGAGLGAQLAALEVDDAAVDGAGHQLAAAAILAGARVAPSITVRIPFGGDNHNDTGLIGETAETTSGVQQIGQFWSTLVDAGIQDEVTFALLNVFGRRLILNAAGGRNHNRDHAVMVAFGSLINPGVYGGVEIVDGAARCLPLTAEGGGQIDRTVTLEAVGASLGIALGHGREAIAEQVRGGQVIDGFTNVPA